MVAASVLVALAFGGLPLAAVKTSAAPTINTVVLDAKPSIPSILERIAFCESGNRQFLEDGRVVRGPDGHDIGKFQIRETVHLKDAQKRNIDIYSEQGNTAYALILFERNGTRDWNASRHCWSR